MTVSIIASWGHVGDDPEARNLRCLRSRYAPMGDPQLRVSHLARARGSLLPQDLLPSSRPLKQLPDLRRSSQ
ncbi:hypothetical protein [Actinomadura coerulea]|uniref:hypothetical protein n=1 Tax=Actinomadura coerulea TaxID=46159 RepID=UPI00343733DF